MYNQGVCLTVLGACTTSIAVCKLERYIKFRCKLEGKEWIGRLDHESHNLKSFPIVVTISGTRIHKHFTT